MLLSLSHTRTHTHSLSLSLSLSHTHTHTHTHVHTHKQPAYTNTSYTYPKETNKKDICNPVSHTRSRSGFVGPFKYLQARQMCYTHTYTHTHTRIHTHTHTHTLTRVCAHTDTLYTPMNSYLSGCFANG